MSRKNPAPNPNDMLQLARASLAAYSALVHPSYKLYKHHALLVDALEAVERGEITRLMISMPPRAGKSLTCSELFPCWYLGRNPSKSVICASYSQEFVEGFGRKVRNYAADPRTGAVFPELKLAGDSSSVKRFDTTAGGSYYAVGRGGAITGRGGDLILVDDILKDQDEARSALIRGQIHEWYASTLFTRKQADTRFVIVATRWHHDDLTGWLLKEHPQEGWHLLNLPAIAETDEGWRREGDPLWPERFPLSELEMTKRMLGSHAWSALYQQRPVPEEGSIFKVEWFRRWSELPVLSSVIVSADTAFQAGSSNDFSVFTAWGVAKNGYYLLDMYRGRVEFPQLKKELIAFATRWKASKVLIESAASGQSLIQELRQGTRLPILAIKPDRDKVSRANAASPLVEAGKVFVPESRPWLADFFYEMQNFPVGAHDDIVDSVTQALNHLRTRTSNLGLLKAFEQLAGMSPAARAEVIEPKSSVPPPPSIAEPSAPPAEQQCGSCGSTLAQKVPGGGRRCGQCGHQWGQPKFEPLASQLRREPQRWHM